MRIFSERSFFESHVTQVSYRYTSLRDLITLLGTHAANIHRIHAMQNGGFGMPGTGGEYTYAEFAALCSERIPRFDSLWVDFNDTKRFYINDRSGKISVERVPADFDIDEYFAAMD